MSVSTSPYYWNHDFTLILPAVMLLAVSGAFDKMMATAAYFLVQVLVFAIGLNPAWASAASALWAVLFCLAKSNGTAIRKFPEARSLGREPGSASQ